MGQSPAPRRERRRCRSRCGTSTDDVAIALAKRGVFVSNGDFYAATIVERLGLMPEGLVRVGCSCYTSEDEVDRLIHGVRALAHGRA